MREVRFRSWSEQTKKMVPWGFIKNGFFSPSTVGGVNMFDMPQMQFTGLTDKNGVEIYEGDIIRDRFISQPGFGSMGFGSSFDREWITEVKVPEIYMHWDENQFGDFEDLKKHFAEGDKDYGVEVIGNRYENPELLPDYKPMEEAK